jgi:hypothetical protein
MTTLGDIIYGGALGVQTRLAGNITATKKFLNQTGDGAASAAPAWNVIGASDLPSAIDAAKIGGGGVSTAEFDFLGTVTSNVQTQIDGKQASLGFTSENSANKDASGGYAGLTLWKINFRNAANTFTSFFTNSNSAARTYIFQDSNDTIVGRATTDTLTNKSLSETQLTFTDITTNNASTSSHGFLKKLSNVSTDFMNGQGNWATPAGVTNSAGANVVPKSDGTNLVAGSLSDDSAGALSTGASVPLSFTSDTSISNITPLWETGNGGTEFKINGNGRITAYEGSAVTDGQLLIGRISTGEFRLGTLTPGTGISVTNGPGSITVAADHTNLGTILPVDMSNGVLSTATGVVYSSPGTTAGLTAGTEGSVSFPVPRAGTIRNLYVRTGTTAKVTTPTTVITIRKNAVDTAVTVTMTQTTSTTTSDTTHSFTVVAGDLITLSFLTTGAAGVSTSIAGVSFELD